MKQAKDLRIPFSFEERRAVILEQFFYVPEFYDKHEQWSKIPFSDPALFGNEKPVAVEFCSGNGKWIGEKAKKEPERNWVAVEKRFDRARKIWAMIQREGLKNLIVACAEAYQFSSFYVPEQSVEEIFINFPDPWPKTKHKKHRLIRPDFLQSLKKISKDEARLMFVTDDLPYCERAIEDLNRSEHWRPLLPKPFYINEMPEYGKSFFKELWQSKGRTIYYLHYGKK